MSNAKKILFVLLAIGMILMMQQSSFKKEGKFGARCSEDSKAIEIFNKNTEKATILQECKGECQLINDMPQCIVKSEIVKEAGHVYLPYLLIAGIACIIFIIKTRRR